MAKIRKIDYCPCGEKSVGFRQGIQCCEKCKKREEGYWTGASATTSRLHGVSLKEVDVQHRAGASEAPAAYVDPEITAAREREERIQHHLAEITKRQDARQPIPETSL